MTGLYRTSGVPVSLHDTAGRVAFGDATPSPGGPDPQPRTDPSAFGQTLRHVTTGAHRPLETTASASTGETSLYPVQFMAATTGIRVWLRPAARSVVSGISATLSIRGTPYVLTWGGSATTTLSGGGAISDPLPEEYVWAEHGDTGHLAIHFPSGEPKWVAKDPAPGGRFVTGDRLLDPFPEVGGPALSAPPWAILGRVGPGHATFIMEGDSGMGPGWARDPLTARGIPWTDHAQFATQIYGHEPTSGGMVPASPWTHCLWALGSNNTNQAQPGTYQKAIDAMYLHADAGVKVAHATLGPRSNSTDAWATLEGQTQLDREWREEWNAWVRDGSPVDNATSRAWVPPGTEGALRAGQPGHMCALPYFDREKYVGATNSTGNVWAAGKLTSDGRHYTEAGATLAGNAFTEWLAENVPVGT